MIPPDRDFKEVNPAEEGVPLSEEMRQKCSLYFSLNECVKSSLRADCQDLLQFCCFSASHGNENRNRFVCQRQKGDEFERLGRSGFWFINSEIG